MRPVHALVVPAKDKTELFFLDKSVRNLFPDGIKCQICHGHCQHVQAVT